MTKWAFLTILADSVTFWSRQNMGRLGLNLFTSGPKSDGVAKVTELQEGDRIAKVTELAKVAILDVRARFRLSQKSNPGTVLPALSRQNRQK